MELVAPTHTNYAWLKVLALQADESACGRYRIASVLEYLRRGGAKVAANVGFTPENLSEYDFVIAQRQYSEETRRFLQYAKRMGKTIIYELDDNVHAIHPSSVVFDSYRPGSEVLHAMEAMIALADGMFTTSAELAGFYGAYQKRSWILPNQIDFGLRDWEGPFERDARLDGKVVIGWAGSITHQDDAAVMGESIRRVLERYPQSVFALCSAYMTMEIFIRDLKLPRERVVRIEPVLFDEYPRIPPNFDISLCPVVNTLFNRSKSDLKILEAGAHGVPYVASKITPYLRFHQETAGQGGYLVDGVQEWEAAIGKLVEDTEERRRKSDWIRSYIRGERSMETNVYRWANALREVRDLKQYAPQGERRILVTEKPGRNTPCPCHSGRKYKVCCTPAFG